MNTESNPENQEEENKPKRSKLKTFYADYKKYFDQIYPIRRFCPIKKKLFVDTEQGWDLAISKISKLKSLSHENKLSHSILGDHLSHWASEEESHLHETRLLIDVPEWDGTERLVKFFSALKIKNFNQEHAWQLFRQFVVNIWRRIENPQTRNWAFILVGDQNIGKDWWIRELLGAFDARYYFQNLNVFADEIRTFMHIDGQVVINISEFDNTKKWDSSFLKDLITKEDISYIGKYESTPRRVDARHSIVASANKMDFLSDFTGSTRFLIFELEEIFQEAYPLGESDQVLAETVALFESGYQTSEDALESLRGYQDVITPPSTLEEAIFAFESRLLAREISQGLTEGYFFPYSEIADDLKTVANNFSLHIFRFLAELKKRGYFKKTRHERLYSRVPTK